MFTTKFSHNWNNKLLCKYFTTIRSHNPKIFYEGAQHTIIFDQKKLKDAEVIQVNPLKLIEINPFIAGLDTGYTQVETINLLETMHSKMKPPVELYDIVLFKTIKYYHNPTFVLQVLKSLMSAG